MAPKLEQSEIQKYWEIFNGLKPVDSKLSGDKVAVVLKNSKLSDGNLSKIWDLADIDTDGQLDFEEFCICMRLIFDLVNQKLAVLPLELPDWLIPSSKVHLIQAKRALSGQDQTPRYSDSSEDEDALGGQFDWYISPGDKTTYEQIYASAADRFGRITFESLGPLLSTLPSVPDQDARFAWNLVNPRSSETIDKDQTLVLLHMLNQRDAGKQMPRGVPPALRATFNKEQPEYSLDSHQATVTQSQPVSKHSFADNYLERMGGSGLAKNTKGTDFSSTQGTDWEEVRLKRELQALEEKVAQAEAEVEGKKSARVNGSGSTLQVRRELEQLLEYKQKQLVTDSKGGADLSGLSADIDTVESQVQMLEQYLERKKAEFSELQGQIVQARG